MDGIVGSITLFAGNFAPKNWAFCNGQVFPITQNSALFSVLGTYYGGNGVTNFALPDLRGRTALGAGEGPGLSLYELGDQAGVETNTLTIDKMPLHSHQLSVTITPSAAGNATATSPKDAVYATGSEQMYNPSADSQGMEYTLELATSVVGGTAPFFSLHPVLGLCYIICINGIFPSRN